MIRLADLPVQRKLRWAMLLTSTIALVLTCGFFLAYEFVGYRRSIARTIGALARVTAANSTAAIAFADATDAREMLDTLRAEPQVLAAGLYDADGKLFASYARSGEEVPPMAPGFLGTMFTDGQVWRVEPVIQDDRRLGTLYLRATLAQLYGRMQIYALVVLGVLSASVALAWLLASILQRTIARPILELASTADAISRGSDYSLRARQYGRDELGRLTAAFNAMLERTQAAVAALRESEARFRHMADGAPVLIWLSDSTQAYTWVNQRWLDFVGRPLAREIGVGWRENIHPDDVAGWLRTFRAAFAARAMYQTEYRLRRYDGVYRWVLDHGIPRLGADGEFNGFIGSCIDVTDRKVAEQEVRSARDKALAASRAKDNFLARLSHELRTPLSPVLLLATDNAQNPELPEVVRADFDMIARHVALEARLIDDLLDLTRIVRGKLSLDLRSCDVHALLQDALGTVWSDLEQKHLRLTLNLGSERVMVWGDAVRLQQVLWNVLKNAVKFTPAEGAIAVQTELVPNENRLLLSITDTGIGMTRDELERIFEAFSQGDHADGATAHRFGGLGLGLAISRMLIELHGGSIRAASPGRGQGSTFTIELPLAVGQAPAAAPSTLEPPMPPAAPSKPAVLSAPGASQRGSVLVVEDHVSTSRALAHLLQRRGFEVVTVDSVAAARQVTHERSFGFIISDIGLPDGTGYALMAELRQNFPSLRGVALSGYGTEQDIMRSREAGFEDHLTKPINVEALDSAIARLASTAKSSPGNSLNER